RVVDAHVEVEGVVHVHRLAVGADPHRPRVLADADGEAGALDLLVIVVEHLGDVHVVGAGVDGVQPLAVGRQGRLPRVGDDVDAVVGVYRQGGATVLLP